MKKYLLTAFILVGIILFRFNSFAQNETARGFIIDHTSNKLIDSARVISKATGNIVYTDKYGSFSIEVAYKEKYLVIEKEGFPTMEFNLPLNLQNRLLTIHLGSNTYDNVNDSNTPIYKNGLSLSILELINAAIGLRYERFLTKKHSIGLHSTYYIYGRNPATMGSEHDYTAYYTGFKIAPFYRFYLPRNTKTGYFVEGKIPVGYFHFYNIRYHYGSNSYPYANVTYDTWSIGAAVAIGGMFRLPKTEHGLINISLGFQYFPTDIPETIQKDIGDGTVLTFHTDNYWWYLAGPGAYFELKFTIGGIF